MVKDLGLEVRGEVETESCVTGHRVCGGGAGGRGRV